MRRKGQLLGLCPRSAVYFILIVCSAVALIWILIYLEAYKYDRIIETDKTKYEEKQKFLRDESDQIAYELTRYVNPNEKFYTDGRPVDSGLPVRVLVVSSWHSGASLLGEVFNSHPANYRHHEPLSEFGRSQIRGEPMASRALTSLRNLLECTYSDMGNYLINLKSSLQVPGSTRIGELCRIHPETCLMPEFLESFCWLFPFQSMEILEMRLKLLETLLDEPFFNVRVVYLVRDPRRIIQDRKQDKWCADIPDCIRPDLLCNDLVDDYNAAAKFRKKYPNTFRALRFEDFYHETAITVQNIFHTFGLHFHHNVKLFLKAHNNTKAGNQKTAYQYNVFEPPPWLDPIGWRQNMPHSKVLRPQDTCSHVLDLWGYY